MGSNLVAVTWSSDIVPALSKEFLDIQANYREWIHSETRTWHDNNILSQDFSVLTQAIFALVLVLHFLPVQQGFLTFSVHKWHYCFFFYLFLSGFPILWHASTSFAKTLTLMSESTEITASSKSLSETCPGIPEKILFLLT